MQDAIAYDLPLLLVFLSVASGTFQLLIGIADFKNLLIRQFSFFQSNHARIDIRIDVSISIRPTTTKFGKEYN